MSEFIKGVFSEPEPGKPAPSASRLIMAFFAVIAAFCIVFAIVHLKTPIAQLDLWDWALFVSSPYLVNQGRAAISDFKK